MEEQGDDIVKDALPKGPKVAGVNKKSHEKFRTDSIKGEGRSQSQSRTTATSEDASSDSSEREAAPRERHRREKSRPRVHSGRMGMMNPYMSMHMLEPPGCFPSDIHCPPPAGHGHCSQLVSASCHAANQPSCRPQLQLQELQHQQYMQSLEMQIQQLRLMQLPSQQQGPPQLQPYANHPLQQQQQPYTLLTQQQQPIGPTVCLPMFTPPGYLDHPQQGSVMAAPPDMPQQSHPRVPDQPHLRQQMQGYWHQQQQHGAPAAPPASTQTSEQRDAWPHPHAAPPIQQQVTHQPQPLSTPSPAAPLVPGAPGPFHPASSATRALLMPPPQPSLLPSPWGASSFRPSEPSTRHPHGRSVGGQDIVHLLGQVQQAQRQQGGSTAASPAWQQQQSEGPQAGSGAWYLEQLPQQHGQGGTQPGSGSWQQQQHQGGVQPGAESGQHLQQQQQHPGGVQQGAGSWQQQHLQHGHVPTDVMTQGQIREQQKKKREQHGLTSGPEGRPWQGPNTDGQQRSQQDMVGSLGQAGEGSGGGLQPDKGAGRGLHQEQRERLHSTSSWWSSAQRADAAEVASGSPGHASPPSVEASEAPGGQQSSGECNKPECREAVEALASLGRLLEVKDQMIWHLLQERNDMLARLGR